MPMKKCSTSLVIIGMQIKTTMRYCSIHIRIVKIKNPPQPSVVKKKEKLELSYTSGGKINCTTILETNVVVS